MARLCSLQDAIAETIHDGDRGDGGFHPPDSVRRRPRDHPAAAPRPHARAHDARPHLRSARSAPAARRASCSPGAAIPASARSIGCATRSSTAGRGRWRSRSTATARWPAPTTRARPTCRSPCCAATAGRSPTVNPNIRSVTCPFTGETLVAVPALRPDVTIIHAQQADREGNVLIEGIIGVQKEAVLAATRAVVTVEEVVETLDAAQPNACILPHWTVAAVAVVPGGAFPSYAHGYYPRDNAFYRRMGRDFAGSRALSRLDRRARAAARPRDASPRAPGGCHGRELDPDRADDRGRVATARGRRRVLRRHRAAVRRLQPRAADPCAWRHADLRIGHDRARARRCCRCRLATASCATRR